MLPTKCMKVLPRQGLTCQPDDSCTHKHWYVLAYSISSAPKLLLNNLQNTEFEMEFTAGPGHLYTEQTWPHSDEYFKQWINHLEVTQSLRLSGSKAIARQLQASKCTAQHFWDVHIYCWHLSHTFTRFPHRHRPRLLHWAVKTCTLSVYHCNLTIWTWSRRSPCNREQNWVNLSMHCHLNLWSVDLHFINSERSEHYSRGQSKSSLSL